MMIILTIVFSNMFRFDIPQYPVYLCRTAYFRLYSEATSMAMGSILGGAALIKKSDICLKYILSPVPE